MRRPALALASSTLLALLAVVSCTSAGPGAPHGPSPDVGEGEGEGGEGEGDAGDEGEGDVAAEGEGEGDVEQLPSFVERTAASTFVARCTDAHVAITLAVLDDGVLRLRYAGALPDAAERPSWAVVGALGGPSALSARDDGGDLRISTPLVDARVSPACVVDARDASGSPIAVDAVYSEDVASGARRMVRALPSGAHVYGLGERTGPLDRRGGAFEMWNTDAYVPQFGGWAPDADPLYQAIPLAVQLVHGRASAVFTDNTHRLQLDVGAADPGAFELRTAGGAVDEYLIAGPTLGDVLSRYTALTGRPPLPPRWALGYHQSRWGYPDSQRVLDVMNEFRARGIGADSVWLDIQHMDGFRSFTFDPAHFASPAALTADAHACGFHVVTIVDPGLKVDASWDVYQQGLAGNHFSPRPRATSTKAKCGPAPPPSPTSPAPARAPFGDRSSRARWTRAWTACGST